MVLGDRSPEAKVALLNVLGCGKEDDCTGYAFIYVVVGIAENRDWRTITLSYGSSIRGSGLCGFLVEGIEGGRRRNEGRS